MLLERLRRHATASAVSSARAPLLPILTCLAGLLLPQPARAQEKPPETPIQVTRMAWDITMPSTRTGPVSHPIRHHMEATGFYERIAATLECLSKARGDKPIPMGADSLNNLLVVTDYVLPSALGTTEQGRLLGQETVQEFQAKFFSYMRGTWACLELEAAAPLAFQTDERRLFLHSLRTERSQKQPTAFDQCMDSCFP